MSDNHDPGSVPDDLTPPCHPRLANLINSVDALRVALSAQRQIPAHDANARMRLIELERMGVWYPGLVPERGRRACEMALMASMMHLRRNHAGVSEILMALPGIVVGARAVAEAYEAASMPGVLKGLAAVEACFEESGGSLILCALEGELLDACIQLVTALRMQGVSPRHDAPEDGPTRSS